MRGVEVAAPERRHGAREVAAAFRSPSRFAASLTSVAEWVIMPGKTRPTLMRQHGDGDEDVLQHRDQRAV